MAVFTFFPLNQNKIRFTLELRKSEPRNQKEPEGVEPTKLTEQLVVDPALRQFRSAYCRVAVQACYEIIRSLEPLWEKNRICMSICFPAWPVFSFTLPVL